MDRELYPFNLGTNNTSDLVKRLYDIHSIEVRCMTKP